MQELLQRPEIKKQVYDKFPVSKAEKRCAIEKATMDGLRFRYAKELYENMPKEKREYK